MTLFKIISIIFLFYTVQAQSGPKKEVSTIHGLLPAGCEGESFTDGVPVFTTNQHAEFYIYGNNLKPDSHVGITKDKNCKYVEPSKMQVQVNSQGHLAIMSFTTPSTGGSVLEKVRYYICLMESSDGKWIYQGSQDKIGFYVYKPLLTPVSYIIIIVLCFSLSSLMSGLNIGLMSLDQNELRLLRNAGTAKEKKYAKKIIPVRRNGNYLLCSILIAATLCNSIATVSIDNFVSDWIAVAIVTVVIVLMCEILPQSICTYFPLAIGARTIYITRACMILTFPVSYPLSMLLNLILGKELVATYTKERLKELLKLTQLPTNEEKIISGTLDLSQKTVEDVMTMLDDVFKLPITAVMDFETIALILASGYSRIPIYVGNKSNILFVLLTKDLALLDPDDKVPVKLLVKHVNYPCRYVPKGVTLDNVLGLFKDSRGHMAFIVDDEVPSDDKDKHVVGLITFEDVIEEIFQMEINDETDTFTDNRSKRKLSGTIQNNSLLSMLTKFSQKSVAPSDNVKLATFHFLSGVDVFSTDYISPRVLISLLGLDIYYSTPGQKLPKDNVYVQGVPADYFVMVLEGQMEVLIGSEDLRFEVGPFKYFGVEALRRDTVTGSEQGFTPDYTLQAINKTLYLKISKVMYDAAVLATRYERFNEVPDISIKSELYMYYKQIIESDSVLDTVGSNTNISRKSSHKNSSKGSV